MRTETWPMMRFKDLCKRCCFAAGGPRHKLCFVVTVHVNSTCYSAAGQKRYGVAENSFVEGEMGLRGLWSRFRDQSRLCRGTDSSSKPMTSFPRFCLPARPLQCRQYEYRSGCASAQGFDRGLLALRFAGALLRREPTCPCTQRMAEGVTVCSVVAASPTPCDSKAR